MKIGTFKVKVNGLSPLLMRSSKGMVPRGAMPGEEGKKTKPTKGETPLSVAEEAAAGAYQRADGKLFCPGSALREALITACRGYEIEVEGKKRKQPLWAIMSGSVFLPEPELLLQRDGQPIIEYDIDLRRVVIKRAGIVRARPTIPLPWGFTALVEYDAIQWPHDTNLIVEMFNNAGRYPGLLEFRPEKGGTFGRFECDILSNGEVA